MICDDPAELPVEDVHEKGEMRARLIVAHDIPPIKSRPHVVKGQRERSRSVSVTRSVCAPRPNLRHSEKGKNSRRGRRGVLIPRGHTAKEVGRQPPHSQDPSPPYSRGHLAQRERFSLASCYAACRAERRLPAALGTRRRHFVRRGPLAPAVCAAFGFDAFLAVDLGDGSFGEAALPCE